MVKVSFISDSLKEFVLCFVCSPREEVEEVEGQDEDVEAQEIEEIDASGDTGKNSHLL